MKNELEPFVCMYAISKRLLHFTQNTLSPLEETPFPLKKFPKYINLCSTIHRFLFINKLLPSKYSLSYI